MQATRTQNPYNAPPPKSAVPSPAPAGATAAEDFEAETPPPVGKVVVVNLDNTGVSDWTFINPRRAAQVGEGVGVQFRNVTGDRTFVISLPVTFKTTDASVKFAVLNRELGAAEKRVVEIANAELPAGASAITLNDVVGYTVKKKEDGTEEKIWHWPPYKTNYIVLEEIDSRSRVRELFREMDVSDPRALESIDLNNYRAALRKADFLTKSDSVIAAAEAVPKQFPALAARLRLLAGRLEGVGTLIEPVDAAARRARQQQAIDELRKVNALLAVDPTNGDAKKKRDELEPIAEGKVFDKGTPSKAVQHEKTFITNELVRLREDVDQLGHSVDLLKQELAKAGSLADLPHTPERAAAARQAVVSDLDGRITDRVTARQAVIDKKIKDWQESETRSRRYVMTWLGSEQRERARTLEQKIAARTRALDQLMQQSVADSEEALEVRLGVDLSGCTTADGTLSCTASQQVPPNQTAIFTDRFMQLATPPDVVFKFEIRFFDEADVPANPTVYMTRAKEKPKAPANSFAWNLVGTLGQIRDPDVTTLSAPKKKEDGTLEDEPAALSCGLLVCADGHRNHFNGSGQLQLRQRIADYFEGSATIAFKSGDLGTTNPAPAVAPVKDEVTFSRYKFSIFAENGLAFEFGKQTFASPSNAISINETGEGFRIIYSPMFVSGAYIVKRESENFAADRKNRDSWVALAQVSNVPLSSAGPFRTISATYVRGFERRFPSADVTKDPYDYQSFGFEASYALPIVNVNGIAALYQNERNADIDGRKCEDAPAICSGRGRATMVTMTRSFGLDPKNKPRRSATLTFARGSADANSTEYVNEGYTGENGTFAPDLIFLKSLVGTFHKAYVRTDSREGLPVFRFGTGIANKNYFGLTYIENNFSPLKVIADVLKINDVVSYSTTVRYHNYRMRRPIYGDRGAGHEIDFEFMIEAPKGVKTTLSAGYYRRGAAVAPFVDENLWSVSSNISVSFGM